MRYSRGFQRLLDYAAHDCAQRGQVDLSADHLFLGLYREDFPLIDEILATFRVDSLVLLERLLRANPETRPPVGYDEVALTPGTLQVIAQAEREASSLGHDVLTPPHAFLGILAFDRDRLDRYFIRREIVHRREEEVLARVRELVSWLRFGTGSHADRELQVLDPDTVIGIQSERLRAVRSEHRKGFAIQLRMLKRLRGA